MLVNVPRFKEFAIDVGVMTGLEIREYVATEMQNHNFSKYGRHTETKIDEDYYINALSMAITRSGKYWHCKGSTYYIGDLDPRSKQLSLSKALWKTICKAKPDQLLARYRPNASKPITTSAAFFIKQLRLAAWIPDKDGVFKKPADIRKEDLHPDFPWDDRNGWLTAIGIGENIRKLSEEYKAKEQAAQSFGFRSSDSAAKWAKLAKTGIDPDELSAKLKKPEFPEAPVNNPERRRKRMLDESANAPDKESVQRERSVQPGINIDTGKAKAYLRSFYINNDNELLCQCCQQEMPFKAQELHYFEAVQCVKHLKKRHIENRLALCPTCAAMYQHARQTEDREVHNRIVNLKEPETSPSVEIPITLAEREYRLRFVSKHWFDLKTILESCNE